VAGRGEQLFDAGAIELLHARSGGLPRVVNQIASSALLEGFARGATSIDAEVVASAIAELDGWLGARTGTG
jgi:type II secretory pathway predicted ATPase ExeA